MIYVKNIQAEDPNGVDYIKLFSFFRSNSSNFLTFEIKTIPNNNTGYYFEVTSSTNNNDLKIELVDIKANANDITLEASNFVIAQDGDNLAVYVKNNFIYSIKIESLLRSEEARVFNVIKGGISSTSINDRTSLTPVGNLNILKVGVVKEGIFHRKFNSLPVFWNGVSTKEISTFLSSTSVPITDIPFIYMNANTSSYRTFFRSPLGTLVYVDGTTIETKLIGTTAQRPTVITNRIYEGFKYYDTTLDKLIYHKGSDIWIEFDGVLAGTNRNGVFASKPTVITNFISDSFVYFCTDKQTTEGTVNGIPIYHKGSDVWVDALGRVIV